ncbi:thiamine biosynthesis protein ThiJ [Agreia sp. Leaf244]|uniref:type 1 glutamine amidotransferase domain-containing protein n=1 Tax=Agreia sp. Leaf244 TaxID=1736305 RepID=UPI0006FADAFA|nr:type 1 glutamine amidotransferase domain-containing protein [Agreia sp. Leaf244]KQO05400.1 thiamine biosynthesis protein ThiJ [Agreia sp. Leaf244]
MARVLFDLTAAQYWTLKDGHRHPTGYWAEEFVAPYRVFTGAGHEVVVATPAVRVPTVDTMSLRDGMEGGQHASLRLEETIEAAEELRHPLDLREVDLDVFGAVFYPGGHGPMEDLSVDLVSGMLLRKALNSGKPLGVVCHAPAAFLATRDEKGDTPFAGYEVTGFSNDEEADVGFAEKAKWLMEDKARELPMKYSSGPNWGVYTVVDRSLFTGRNPASSSPVATEKLKAL